MTSFNDGNLQFGAQNQSSNLPLQLYHALVTSQQADNPLQPDNLSKRLQTSFKTCDQLLLDAFRITQAIVSTWYLRRQPQQRSGCLPRAKIEPGGETQLKCAYQE